MKYLKWLLFTPTYDWVIDGFLGLLWWAIGIYVIIWLWALLLAQYLWMLN